MAFCYPPHLREEWHQYVKMREQILKNGTADSNINMVKFRSLQDLFKDKIDVKTLL